MDISRHLAEREDKDSLQIIFTGEPFNSHSLTRLRDETLPEGFVASNVVAQVSADG